MFGMDELKQFFEPLGFKVWAKTNKRGTVKSIGLYRSVDGKRKCVYEWRFPGVRQPALVTKDQIKLAVIVMKRRDHHALVDA